MSIFQTYGAIALFLILVFFPVKNTYSASNLSDKQQSKHCHQLLALDKTSISTQIIKSINKNRIWTNKNIFNFKYSGAATLEGLQQAMFENGLINLDEIYRHLNNKEIMSQLLHYFLDDEFEDFHPKTSNAQVWMNTHNIKDKEKIIELLSEQFGKGTVLKLAQGVSSGGQGMVFGHANVSSLLLSMPAEKLENWILQSAPENISGINHVEEYRVHTLWGKVIPGTTLSRWKVFAKNEKKLKVENFVQKFLNKLPENLQFGQAWSMDVIQLGDNMFQIVDINVADAKKENWSGFLQNPIILTKLVHHLKREFGWTFEGLNGFLLKNYMGNYDKARRKLRNMVRKHGLFNIAPTK